MSFELTEALDLFLADISKHLSDVDSKAAPRFNAFHCLRLKENTATVILNDFLDPRGSHGQGSIFLESFLKFLPVNPPGDREFALVHTEECTDEKRRIDLTVRIGNWMLGVENKIGAGEQREQVADYIKFLEKKSPGNWFFVFLTPDGRDPRSCPGWSDYKDKTKCLSYSDLSGWIDSWANLCKADRVKPFLTDLASWAKNPFGGQMYSDSVKKEMLDVVARNPQNLQALLAIVDCFGKNQGELFREFVGSLKAKLQNLFTESDGWKVEASIEKWPGVSMHRQGVWPSECTIGFSANAIDQDFGFGVYWPKADERKYAIQKVLDEKFGEGQKNKQWPWYRNLPLFGDVEVHRWLKWEVFHASRTQESKLVDHFAKLLSDVEHTVGSILSKR